MNQSDMSLVAVNEAAKTNASDTPLERPRDGEMAGAAKWRLRASPYFALRTVAVEAREGVLMLSGQVASYFHKQMVQESVRGIKGVRAIINGVEVNP